MRYKLMELGLNLKNRNVFSVYKKLLETQSNSLEEKTKEQEMKLVEILLHAYEYVPYYKKILIERGVIKDGEVILDNFVNVPILTKELIRENFDDLISTDANYSFRGPYLNTSGGSTGEPVKFYQDNEVWKNNMAVKWLYYSFVSKYPCKLVKLWGSERDILEGGIGFQAYLQNLASNRVVLNAFRMTKSTMYDYVNKINRIRPEIIEGYVQSIYELALFVSEKKLYIHKPKGIITSAGTLYPEMREKLESVFGCVVYNRYGSREVGDIACSCSEGNELHINNHNLYVEILGDDYLPSKPGELGKVYVTTLDNFSMPLIKYDVGDIAVLSNKKDCGCGRSTELLEKVEGREMSIFKTKGGNLIPGEFFIHFVGVVFNEGLISKFQVIQEDYDSILIKVVPLNKIKLEKRKEVIESSIKKVMGSDCLIKWEYVENIECLNSGKYLYTVSKVL